MLPYHKNTFKNGLRLVTVPMANTKAVTVLILVGAGSKYELKEINGVSHFLEHMLFKGTKKRPNSFIINKAIDEIGGENNAFTDKEATGYWAKVNNKHLDTAIDWVSDIFLNSKIAQAEIDRERGVIIEEYNMYLDTPQAYVLDLWEKLLYGNQPAGRLILGEKETIKSLNRKDFINYKNKHYTSKNTVIVIAGNISNINKLEKKVKDFFHGIPIGDPRKKEPVKEKQNKPGLLAFYKKTDQSHSVLGTRTFDMFHKDKYVLDVMAAILGQGMSSRLFIDIRERNGLAYYVKTQVTDYTDSGFLFTRTGVDNKRIEMAINIILKHYKLLKEKKVGIEELKKAKEFIKGHSILGMESSNEQALFYGAQELLEGNILTLDEKIGKIEAVTADDIKRVANDIFKPEKLNLTIIGPQKNQKLLKLLKI